MSQPRQLLEFGEASLVRLGVLVPPEKCMDAKKTKKNYLMNNITFYIIYLVYKLLNQQFEQRYMLKIQGRFPRQSGYSGFDFG